MIKGIKAGIYLWFKWSEKRSAECWFIVSWFLNFSVETEATSTFGKNDYPETDKIKTLFQIFYFKRESMIFRKRGEVRFQLCLKRYFQRNHASHSVASNALQNWFLRIYSSLWIIEKVKITSLFFNLCSDKPG